MSPDTTGEDREKGGSIVDYGIDENPSLGESIPLSIQHLLAMVVTTVLVPIIILGGFGASSSDTTFIIQMALFVAGIATIVQAYRIGPVGARLPIVMGTSAIFILPLVTIGNTYGLAAIFGAVIIAAPVEIIIGKYYDKIRQFFPPLVTGVVIMLIGLTVVDVALDNAAGGVGAETYGNYANLGLAALVIVSAIGLNQFFKGIISAASVLFAIVIGYLIAFPLGMVDLSPVQDASWFAVPVPLQYGLEFHPIPILLVGFAYIITAMETIGDITGTTEVVGREPTNEEMSGGLIADGVMSAFAALFNAFPNTSFSQNVGLIGFTGVASRYIVALTGVLLVVLGFIPKLSAFVTAMPSPVLGGAIIVLFGMILSLGLRVIAQSGLNRRNLIIVGTSIVLGLGVEWRPEVVEQLPSELQVLFGSGLIMGGGTAFLLNIILPKDDETSTQTTASNEGLEKPDEEEKP